MTTDSAIEEQVAELLDARIGLRSDASFRPRLARALRDIAAVRNIDRERLTGALASNASLLDDLLDRVTVQETAFFRHPEQFEALRRVVLPGAAAPLRAWSAATANGQEAYSLAMLFTEAGRSGSVLASDICPAALRRTAAGYYAEREMGGVAPERRRQHFTDDGHGFTAKQGLRDMVAVQRHNLIDPIPPQVAECHVVMCRNVLIYFSESHARLFLDRLADVMNPDAYLFVGGAETLWQTTDRFEPMQLGTCYAYRPRSSLGLRGAPVSTTVSSTALPSSAAPRVVTTSAPAPLRAAVPAVDPPITERGAPPVLETGHVHERLGRQLLARGAVAEAIVAFRRWSYQCPEDPLAHFQLAVALERSDDKATARRAYRAALAAFDRSDPEQLRAALKGYERDEWRRLLADRCATPTAIS